MRSAAAVLLVALAVAGCGGDDDDSEAAATETRCAPASAALMTPLSSSLENELDELSNGWVVKSRDHEDIWYVSAELDGPGFQDDGDIATFAANALGGTALMYAVNELANDHSSLRDGVAIAGLSMEEDGAQESFDCAKG